MPVLVNNVVLDIHPAQGHPQDDATGAVPGHHVVIDLHIADRGIARDLQPTGGVGVHDIIQDDLVFAAQIQTVVQIAARAPVVVYPVAAINIAAGVRVRINAVPAIGAAAGRVAIMVDMVVEDLVAIAIHGEAAQGGIADFKSIDDVVTAVNIEPLIAVGGVLPVNDRSVQDLRLQHDGTGGRAAFTKVDAPAAGVIGIDP